MGSLRAKFALFLLINVLVAVRTASELHMVQMTGLSTATHAGGPIYTAGDFNGDRILDYITGSAPGFMGCAAVVILGGSPTPDSASSIDVDSGHHGLKIYSPIQDKNMETLVGSAGDVNGDGFDDVLVGVVGTNGVVGVIYVVFGRIGPYKDLHLEDPASSNFGFQITGKVVTDRVTSPPACLHSGVGDVNGDGIQDFAIGTGGVVYVIYGKIPGAPIADVNLDSSFGGVKLSGMELVVDPAVSYVVLRPAKNRVPADADGAPQRMEGTTKRRQLEASLSSGTTAEASSQKAPVSSPVPPPLRSMQKDLLILPNLFPPRPVAQPTPTFAPSRAPGLLPILLPPPVQRPQPVPVAPPVQPPQPVPVAQPQPKPQAQPQPVPVQVPVQKPQPRPVVPPQPVPVPVPVTQPVAPPRQAPQPTPVVAPKPLPQPAPQPKPVTPPKPVTQPQQLPQPKPVTPPKPLPQPAPQAKPVTPPRPVAQPQPLPQQQPVTLPRPTPQSSPVAQPQAKPQVRPVVPPASPPVSRPVSEPVVQPVAQPVSEPVAQPVTEPVSQPVSQPVAQPVAEPVAQPVSQPVSEPVAQPVPQPVPEPTLQPTEEPTASPTAPVFLNYEVVMQVQQVRHRRTLSTLLHMHSAFVSSFG
jgi:hypothetical protein